MEWGENLRTESKGRKTEHPISLPLPKNRNPKVFESIGYYLKFPAPKQDEAQDRKHFSFETAMYLY